VAQQRNPTPRTELALVCTNIKLYYSFVQSVERWSQLYEVAASQAGYFTAAQASDSGFSLQLLKHHYNSGKVQRIRRGIYRITHFPSSELEDLVVLWLWSEMKGVFSHGTALDLWKLADYIPMVYFMTLPLSWKKRRLRVPGSLELFYSDLDSSEICWHGPIPITAVGRTLRDCECAGIGFEWLKAARNKAVHLGLVDRQGATR